MKKLIVLYCLIIASAVYSQNRMSVSSPDGELILNVLVKSGQAVYSVTYKGGIVLEDSPLGLITNFPPL